MLQAEFSVPRRRPPNSTPSTQSSHAKVSGAMRNSPASAKTAAQRRGRPMGRSHARHSGSSKSPPAAPVGFIITPVTAGAEQTTQCSPRSASGGRSQTMLSPNSRRAKAAVTGCGASSSAPAGVGGDGACDWAGSAGMKDFRMGPRGCKRCGWPVGAGLFASGRRGPVSGNGGGPAAPAAHSSAVSEMTVPYGGRKSASGRPSARIERTGKGGGDAG